MVSRTMENSYHSEKIPAEKRVALVHMVDLLVARGYKQKAAIAEVGITRNHYNRWKSALVKNPSQLDPPTQEAS